MVDAKESQGRFLDGYRVVDSWKRLEPRGGRGSRVIVQIPRVESVESSEAAKTG